METYFLLPAAVAGLWAMVGVVRCAGRIVRANRLRTQELKLAVDSALHGPAASEQLDTLRRVDAAAEAALREDYGVTGAVLAGLGAAGMFVGRGMAYGEWAVGLYAAGMIAILAGFSLAILGAVLRQLSKPIL